MDTMGSYCPSDVFDPVRACWVRATPEEQVRQRWLKRMIDYLGYPKQLLVVEKEIKRLPHLSSVELPERRVDILSYKKEGERLKPLLLIECKEGALSEEALSQVLGYNHYIKASCVAIVNAEEVCFAAVGIGKRFSSLPSFKEMNQWF